MEKSKDRVLMLLASNEWVSTWDLVQAGGTEGLRRLRELRNEGYVIEKRRKEDSAQWEYHLAR